MMDQDKVKEWVRMLKSAKYKMAATYLYDSSSSKDEPKKQCTCDFVTVVLRTGCKCGGS
jgi:hypothetical protein